MSGFSFLKPPAPTVATTGGLFGTAPAPAVGGLFGQSNTQQQGGGLFGSAQNQQQPQQQSGGLFGNTGGQQQTGGGLFGNTQSQQQQQPQQQAGGPFSNSGTQQQPGGLFGNTQNQQQQQQQQQPQQQAGGLFGGFGGSQQQQQKPNLLNLNLNPSGSTASRSTQPQIDIEHLRPNTKFDHLTPALQSEIEGLDALILKEISMCNELQNALPGIIESGKSVPQDYAYVQSKYAELELALENDAADIVDLRDRVVRRDVAEGRLCWKSVDRLKMPAQYQTGHHATGESRETVYGGSGLSGWWNHPTMSTRTRHGVQKNVVAVDTEEEVEVAGGTLVDLLNGRAEEMRTMLRQNSELLGEIEGFVGGVEGKIAMKEREVSDGVAVEGRDRQVQMLRYVFGEVERSLYEVADRVGESRDGLMDLGERSVRARMAY